jgi:DNA-binding MarR family transcriptional regulator
VQLQAIDDNNGVMTTQHHGEPTEAAISAWVNLIRAGQATLARIESELKTAGLPDLAWYDVLFELDRAPDGWLRQSDVSGRLLLAQYNLSRLVDRLERENLVTRRPCERDGRNNVLVITDKGRALRARMWPVYAAAIEAHVGRHLTEDDARTLADLLQHLRVTRDG